jgi:hypothetical protein
LLNRRLRTAGFLIGSRGEAEELRSILSIAGNAAEKRLTLGSSHHENYPADDNSKQP